MNVITSTSSMETIVLGLQPGELLLESIRKAISDHDIRNGTVVSGIGTLSKCVMHYIKHTRFPFEEGYYTIEKPLELVALSGIIADYQPHLHIVLSCMESETWAGHLEDNSVVAYLAEVVILKCNELSLTRVLDPVRKVKLLQKK